MKFLGCFICIILFFSCSENTLKQPKNIFWNVINDSVYITVKNSSKVPTFLRIKNLLNKQVHYIDFNKPDSLVILKFLLSKIDSAQFFKNNMFKMFYGASKIDKYDTLYNYALPFLKGKKYKVLQGNNGKFSHKGQNSKYAIDFKMNVGETICAIRDGYVVFTKSDSNEGGSSKKYLPKANKIFVYHKDGTFAQYAHFKQNGVLVNEGDSIKKGQIIGYSGNTGYSTEPHLHFVVYKPSKEGLTSIPFILNNIPTKKYKKGKYAHHI